MNIKEWTNAAHKNAQEKGFWDSNGAPFQSLVIEKLCLVHTEISEAVEEWRNLDNGLIYTEADGKPAGLSIELADAMLRIMDLAGGMGIDLEKALELKHQYNKTRPHRHGRSF